MALASAALWADDKPGSPTPREELDGLKKEFADAQHRFFAERNRLAEQIRETKDDAQRKALEEKLRAWQEQFAANRPLTKLGPRFLRFAERHPGPEGVEALELVLREEYRLAGVPKAANSLWAQAVDLLHRRYVAVPEVRPLLPLLAVGGAWGDPAAEEFVRAVLVKNPDRLTQARAAQALAEAGEFAGMVAARLKSDDALRKQFDSKDGQGAAGRWIARGEQARTEAPKLRELIRRKYGDLIPDLLVGRKAPEVKCQDLDGKNVRLSDYRGKVVVLDIWETNCLACRAMISHQRDLVRRLKDRPFALISISADSDKGQVKRFLAREPMPWVQWWNGPKGGIMEDWGIWYFPTIYVLDAEGVIRYKDHEGEFADAKLDEAVQTLLAEAEQTRARR
jgi:peroxiredoxin